MRTFMMKGSTTEMEEKEMTDRGHRLGTRRGKEGRIMGIIGGLDWKIWTKHAKLGERQKNWRKGCAGSLPN